MKCPRCGRFAHRLTSEERKPKYIGSYQHGIPNSTAIICYYGDCWVRCKKCGIVDP